MNNNLENKIDLVRKIMSLINREGDDHLRADLYKLTNKSLLKLTQSIVSLQEGQRSITGNDKL